MKTIEFLQITIQNCLYLTKISVILSGDRENIQEEHTRLGLVV